MAIVYVDGKLITSVDGQIVPEDMMPPINNGSVIRVGKHRFIKIVDADKHI
jgi:hypothetical protein